jgi:hypothetical protein
MDILILEIKKFSKENWWIYIIFTICLITIWYTEKWSILEVVLVFCAHFLWDLFMMMMWEYYSKKKFKEWAISQALWNIVFLLIWIYAIFKSSEWQYFLPTFAFIMWAVKTYFLQVKSKDIKFLNIYSVLILNLAILLIYIYFGLFDSYYSYIQFLGFTIWSSWLILQDSKNRYTYYVLGTFLIALGSFIWIYINFFKWIVLWTNVSYFLLPLTVVIFYLKNLKKYL